MNDRNLVKADTLSEQLAEKRCLFDQVFGRKYSLKLLELQGWVNGDGRIIKEVSFTFGELMKALGIRAVCKKLAKWLDGDLIGAVNLDFYGDVPSLEMMVETLTDE